jgi:predicted P-loop ATPase
MLDRSISISLYAPPESARARPVRHETTIQELITSLCEPPLEVTSKGDAPAWSPIVYSGERRLSAEATGACALVYDLDDPGFDLEPVGRALHNARWVYAIHGTYTQGCARLILPLASDVAPASYAALRETIASALGLVHDPACSDLARLFYAPSRPVGSERDQGETGGDRLLDPADFVTERPRNLLERVRAIEGGSAKPPPEISPKIFDLGALREEATEHSKPETRAKLLALIDGTLVVPPGERETMLHPLLGSLSHLRNAPGEEGCATLLRRIFARRDGHETMMDEWVDKALYSYTRGEHRKEVLDQQAAVVEKFFRDEKWREKLKQKMTKDGGVLGMLPMECNIMDVLNNDENFSGHVRWNLLKQRIEVTGGVLAKEPVELLDVPAAVWFQKSEYNCPVSRDLVGACVQHVALHNGYDPVAEYLSKLPKWDGRERLANVLLHYAQAKGSMSWIRTVSRKFFIAAIARALRPGCQVDNVLVLQGDQGGGKTSFVRVMGAGFSVETNLDLQSKDAVMVSASAWLVELGELASLKRSDVESVRNFITRKEDAIRLPYGRSVKNMPRRCVFLGTTNSRQPLTDPEGNRRFWVVSVGKVDTEGLERVRDQLWAEALHLFQSGEQWWLTPEENEIARSEASVYEAEDINQTEILAFLEAQKKWPKTLSASEVATKILKMSVAQLTPQMVTAINRSMGAMGWRRTRKRVVGVPTWCYEVPSREELQKRGDLLDDADGKVIV